MTAYDSLTGVWSSTLVQDYLSQHSRCSIILIDINQFRVFNTCYGPTEGDRALIRVATIIRQLVPAQSRVFRSSGDEFAVVMARSPTDAVLQLAHHIKETVKDQFSHLPGGQWVNVLQDNPNALMQTIPFTVSCGIAFYPEHGHLFQHLRTVIYHSVFDRGESDVVAIVESLEDQIKHSD